MRNPGSPSLAFRGFGWSGVDWQLLAAFALQHVHRVDRHGVAADGLVIVVHGALFLLKFFAPAARGLTI